MIAEQMANWLIGSILFSLGALVLVSMCVLINNLLHKYWKPITVVFFRNESMYPKTVFTTAEDKDAKEPQFEQQKDIDKTKN